MRFNFHLHNVHMFVFYSFDIYHVNEVYISANLVHIINKMQCRRFVNYDTLPYTLNAISVLDKYVICAVKVGSTFYTVWFNFHHTQQQT